MPSEVARLPGAVRCGHRAWRGRWSGWRTVLAGGLALAWGCACSPAFNWRDVRPPGSALQALMPCKPESAQRDVALAGHPVALTMLSCEAGGLTFAVAALHKPPVLTAQAVMQAWRQASLSSLGATPAQAHDWQPAVPLAGPATLVSGWQAQGVRHSGQPVQAHVLLLARANEVFQVAVYGPVRPEVLTTLLDGLRLDAHP